MKNASHPAAVKNLFSRPDPQSIVNIEKTLAAVARVLPLSTAHAKDLPFAVRDLSRLLTSERGDLAHSYWAAPRFASAYLRYFLPWNLYRLAWLLPNLDLALRPGSTILDLGSGPLTLPLGLWCSRPDLRAVPLRFVCVDVAAKALERGRDILATLSGPASPWKIETLRAPLDKALRQAQNGGYSLIMAGNVLNEACPGRPEAESHLAGRLDELAALAFGGLVPDGRFFLLEPGTRLGGKLVALFRKGAVRHGFSPLAPCTHAGPCPTESADASGRGGYSGWCHFIHPADGAPPRLFELTRRARLEKDSLAVSCLLLERPTLPGDEHLRDFNRGFSSAAAKEADDLDDLEALYHEIMSGDAVKNTRQRPDSPSGQTKDGRGRGVKAPPSTPEQDFIDKFHDIKEQDAGRRNDMGHCRLRIISGPIRLPDEEAPARYACCEQGLALLKNATRIPSGAGVTAAMPEHPRKDAKSGALLLEFEPAQKPYESAKKSPTDGKKH